MSNFKPHVRVITRDSQLEYRNHERIKSPYKTVSYSTYRELKKNLKKHLEENLEDYVPVSRSRRGEWGEWFEHWQLVGGKLKIVSVGWM